MNSSHVSWKLIFMVNFITEFHLFYISLMIISSILILHLWFSFDIVLSDFKMLIMIWCIVFIWCRLVCVISPVTGNTQKKFDFFVLECNIFLIPNIITSLDAVVFSSMSHLLTALSCEVSRGTLLEKFHVLHIPSNLYTCTSVVLNLCCEGSLFSGVYVVG